ncbi:MAG TPA: hypothetical protein PK230_04685 [Chitinophagales bacterium]|nr:hypothetical protein [Chitinophagales bacterium]
MNMSMKSFVGLLPLFFLFLLPACTNETSDFVPPKPSVSHIKTDLKIQRFEKDLFAIDTNQAAPAMAALAQKYPEFYPLFVGQIMGFGAPNTPKQTENLLHFLKDPDMRHLYDTVQRVFPNLEAVERDFNHAFQYSRYYLPKQTYPQLISHISAFGPASFTLTDSILAFNLDMFLGENFPYYRSIGDQMPYYIRRRCEPAYLVPNTMKAYINGIYGTDNPPNKLLDQMILEGKMLYYLDLVLPDTPDSLKIGYTQKQVEWCQHNEPQIWAFLTEKDLLFSTQAREFRKMLNEAPTTSGMPPESPGRVGVWVGWQIIRRLMSQNPDLTFEQLMSMNDAQKLLQMSKYKPK